MPSSLASQLAKGVSLNAPLLSETARKRHYASSSYLFSVSSKSQIDDLDAIHALATNALEHLKHIYPSVLTISDKGSHTYRYVFSQHARDTDRTLLTPDELTELNTALKRCMQALGPCLLEGHTGRVIEWLVRRFRVNEFNVSDILTVFFPYHDSPHFAKMVSILTIDDNCPWRFLSSYKILGKPLARSVLVTEMLKSGELTRLIVTLLPDTMTTSKGVYSHRTLFCFNTSVLLEYISRAGKKSLDAGLLAVLLPSLTEPLKVGAERSISQDLIKDGVLGSFVLLAALSQKCQFTPAATRTIASGMVHCVSASMVVDAHQLVTALLSFLSGQETLNDLPNNCIDEFISLPDVIDALRDALQWTGFEKLLLPMLGRIVRHDAGLKAQLIEFILSSDRIPESILRRVAKLSLSTSRDVAVLSLMSQKHPKILQDAKRELVIEDEASLQDLDDLLLELTIPGGSGGGFQDFILAASNSEASTRATSVKRLAEIFSSKEKLESISGDDRASILQVLQARIMDPDFSVVETLYQHQCLLDSLFSNYPDTIEILTKNLKEQLSPSVLRAHLIYFCNSYLEIHPEDVVQVFRLFVLPFALYTKSREEIADTVWDVVKKSRLVKHKLFKGLSDITLGEDLSKKNVSIATKLAENIKSTKEYPEILDWLLRNLSDSSDAHSRLISLLTLHALVHGLAGEQKIDLALKLYSSIVANGINISQPGQDSDRALEEVSVLKGIASKPNSTKTVKNLELYVLTLLTTITHPSGSSASLNWFTSDVSSTLNDRFLHLQKCLYALLNAAVPSTKFVSQINQNLFSHFGYDILLFLSSLWTLPPSVNGIGAETTRYIALRHALAFIRAKTSDIVTDFQTVLPSFLIPLQSSDRRVRSAAMDCVTTLAAAVSKPTSVYAYDAVYGPASVELKYLEWPDELHLLQLLAGNSDHLVNDPDHFATFSIESLSPSKAEVRKETRQRRRILSYLISHAVCCPSPVVRLSILRSVRHVSDSVKFQLLLPLIESQLSRPPSKGTDADVEKSILEAFDGSAAKDLNQEEDNSWNIMNRALKFYHGLGIATVQWATICENIKNSLFSRLTNKRQLELSLALIDLGVQADDEFGVKGLLGSCITQPALIVALLQSVQPDVNLSAERASKKAKTDQDSSEFNDVFSRITLLAEVLSSKELPGSLELVSTLLDSLSRIISFTASNRADLLYVEQLLMTCIESAASSIKELPNLSPNVIRIDALVELMRTSENPQTFHQALLLMASLARLSPASVLSNIMPIFTFMGSNVFHRDDSYSFKVIQKTTESIVPVAVASLKEKYTVPLDLLIGSRDLLRTFTDASPHIPRHRRTNFFAHLVDVLNPSDYLAPVTILLADKVSNRVSRQSKQEAVSTLSLPLNVLAHHKPVVISSALKEIIQEVKRLIDSLSHPDSAVKTFLDASASDEHAVSIPVVRKRQCQTLLLLVGIEMKHLSTLIVDDASRSNLKPIVTSLLEILSDESLAPNVSEEVVETAQWALLESLNIISVSYFAETALSILSSENSSVIKGTLDLLAVRVPEIKVEARKSISPVMSRIVHRIQEITSRSQEFDLISRSMQALLSIASSSQSGEESELSETISVVTQTVSKFPDLRPAIALISILTTKLGPRILPHLRSLISSSISVLKSAFKSRDNDGLEIIGEGLKALSSLIVTVPAFWGQKDVNLILNFFVDRGGFSQNESLPQLDKLIKLLAKQIPSKVVIPSLLQCWPPNSELRTSDGVERYERFSELLKHCLHFSSRPDVLESLRAIFAHFLEAFDSRLLLSSEAASKLEDKTISAFLELVTKLNETAFQPLFRKACDWAFGDESSPGRKTTFCRLYTAHLDLFKDIMTPYMSLLLNHFVELLESYVKGENDDKDLWLASISTLSKSFAVDDRAFWRDEKLRRIIQPLTSQIPLSILNLHLSESQRSQLSDSLTACVECMEDDTTANSLNRAVLMLTRSEDSRVRLFALQCTTAIWKAHGAKLRGFGPETATFIIECADDENDGVVRECRRLKEAVENVTGKIDGL